MDASAWVDATPRDRARAASRALGRAAFAGWCAEVVTGRADLVHESVHDPEWLAGRAWAAWGPPESWEERGLAYWPRVWAARSLLHAWDPLAEPAVIAVLADPEWRVREMAGKVVAAHDLPAAERCVRLVRDPVSRVRAAAVRVLGAQGEAEHAGAIAALLDDPDRAVRAAAERSAGLIERRLDRSFADLLG